MRPPGVQNARGDGNMNRRSTAITPLMLALALTLLTGVLVTACGFGSSVADTAATTAQAAGATTGDTGSTAAAGASATQSGSGAPGAPPGGSAGGGSTVYPTNAAYTQSGGSKSDDGKTYSASEQDQSGILVTDGGTLKVGDATIQTTGNSSSNDSSSFYGLNAALVATSGSSVELSDSSISTTGSGANGAFATGQGSSVTLCNVKITATGGGGHGVMATQGGSVTLTDVEIDTSGANSAPLATDRGGGTITASGGTAVASGQDSPALYSTGTIKVTGGTYQATGAEAAVIEGGNTIELTDVALSSSKADKWGVMIYQSMSGDAAGTKGTFKMTGGSLSYSSQSGPLFHITNSTGVITLKGVNITAASGVLLKAAAGNWGSQGANGGTAVVTANGQALTGDLVADSISSVTLTLENGSSLKGGINADKAAKEARVTLGATSTWDLTADSHLTSLTLTGGVSGKTITSITGNGHTIYYDATDPANSTLGGETFSLNGGGTLRPAA
jgi:hypothetical protein